MKKLKKSASTQQLAVDELKVRGSFARVLKKFSLFLETNSKSSFSLAHSLAFTLVVSFFFSLSFLLPLLLLLLFLLFFLFTFINYCVYVLKLQAELFYNKVKEIQFVFLLLKKTSSKNYKSFVIIC